MSCRPEQLGGARLGSRNPPGVNASPAAVRVKSRSPSSLRSKPDVQRDGRLGDPRAGAAACLTEPRRTTGGVGAQSEWGSSRSAPGRPMCGPPEDDPKTSPQLSLRARSAPRRQRQFVRRPVAPGRKLAFLVSRPAGLQDSGAQLLGPLGVGHVHGRARLEQQPTLPAPRSGAAGSRPLARCNQVSVTLGRTGPRSGGHLGRRLEHPGQPTVSECTSASTTRRRTRRNAITAVGGARAAAASGLRVEPEPARRGRAARRSDVLFSVAIPPPPAGKHYCRRRGAPRVATDLGESAVAPVLGSSCGGTVRGSVQRGGRSVEMTRCRWPGARGHPGSFRPEVCRSA